MRLIDADKFDAVMGNIFDHLYESGRADLAGTLAAFMDMAKKQPTIDAVPVVRCKDCRKSYKKDKKSKLEFSWCSKWENIMRDCDFCAYGERKDGDGNV